MDRSLLVKVLGFPATLLHGDTLVADRWRWLKRRLPETANGERLLDVGCGTGAFTIGASRRGYQSLGLSWDKRNQDVAGERAALCRASSATFEILDVRRLSDRTDLVGAFDQILCLEVAEHILDDRKLVRDMAACLKPGGRLLFTTPNYHYRAITRSDNGPFQTDEAGWHVRRGYTRAMLEELCEQAGMRCEEISFCSGVLSQKAAWLFRKGSQVHPVVGMLMTLPARPLIAPFDWLVTRALGYPQFSICMEAYKPRYPAPSCECPGRN